MYTYLVGSSEDKLHLWLWLSLVPRRTHLCFGQRLSSLSSRLRQQSLLSLSCCPQHQQEDRPRHQVFTPGLLGCRKAQGAAYSCILVACILVRECPGVMATLARQSVASSKDKGHPYHQFFPLARCQSESVVSWRAAMVKAAGSCDGT